MTEHNIFQEIDEDLQRQKLEALWKRYGIFVIALAIAIVLATAGINAWQNWHRDRAQTATAALVDLLNTDSTNQNQQIENLNHFADTNSLLTQATLARLNAAALALQSGKQEEAIKIYETISNDVHADTALRQLAELRSIEIQLSTGDIELLLKRLEPLADENAPWHFTAQEYQGYLALRAGDKVKARRLFMSLSQNARAPHTMSQRANDILHSISE